MTATLASKPARSINVIGKASDGSDLVRIVEGSQTDYYRVRRIGGAGVGRFVCAKSGTTESYAVDVHPRHCSCECWGFLRWSKCRHVSGLRALDAAGKLS